MSSEMEEPSTPPVSQTDDGDDIIDTDEEEETSIDFNKMKDERKEESAKYFESKSPPAKKPCLSSFKIEDGSDDEDLELPPTVPVSVSFEMADSSPEYESSQGSVRESSVISEVSTKNIKHPDLDCQRVRQVVNLLFSPKIYQLTLKQLGIPEDKSDGIITEDCLSSVEDILKEIQDVLQTPGEDRDGKQLLKLSYDYYCNIPTISPVPSYISSNSELYTKFQILNFLTKMKDSSNIKDNLVKQYLSLKSKITALDRSGDQFKQILRSIGSTNFPRISCIIRDIYEVKRQSTSSDSTIEPRMLLWYSCVAGLVPDALKNGITVPTIPNPDFRCGNAIYLSDMFSESLKQAKSFRIEDFPHCFVFLCEVNIGRVHQIRHKESFDTVPDGYNCVKCVGRTYTDPRGSITGLNGAELQAGKLVQNGVFGTEWDFNSYAIFNPDQVKIRYLCHVELAGDSQPSRIADPTHLPFGKVVHRGVWKYASGKRWIEYDKESSDKIEEYYQRKQQTFHLMISGKNYTVNLDRMVQYQTENPKKSRKIKRE